MSNTHFHKVKITNGKEAPSVLTKCTIDGKALKATGYTISQHTGDVPRMMVNMLPALDVDFEKCVVELGNIKQIAQIITRSQLISLIKEFNSRHEYDEVTILGESEQNYDHS